VKLSKQSEYALRALVRLSSCWPRGQMRMHELAELEGIPAYFLSNIMTRLRQHKILRSSTGAKGGFRLARPPQRILISDLIACLESSLSFENGRRDGRGSSGQVMVQRLERLLTERINATLRGLTLADIIQQVAALQVEPDSSMYYI
jgi:Rrf2 family transcriptional regulator, cysteine metabolism repressor